MKPVLRYTFIIWLVNLLFFLTVMVFHGNFNGATFAETISALFTLAFLYPAPILLVFTSLNWILVNKQVNALLGKAILSLYVLFIIYLGKVIFYIGFVNADLSWLLLKRILYDALNIFEMDWFLFGVPTLITIWILKLPGKSIKKDDWALN